MKRSTDRIIVSHAGVLPRPADLREAMAAGETRAEVPRAAARRRQRHRRPAGRRPASTWSTTASSARRAASPATRASASAASSCASSSPARAPSRTTSRAATAATSPSSASWASRRAQAAPLRPVASPQTCGGNRRQVAVCWPAASPARAAWCSAPARSSTSARSSYKTDIANLKAALAGNSNVEGYLPAVAPGTMEHWLRNEYYKTDEEFLYAIADAMARGVQGDHGRRPHPADRRPGPAGRLADVPGHDARGVPQVRRPARRGAEPRPEGRAARADPLPHLLGSASTARTWTTSSSSTSST